MNRFATTITFATIAMLVPLISHGATLGLGTNPDGDHGEHVVVPIRIEVLPSESVASLQFELRFDPKALHFASVHTGGTAQAAEKSAHANLVQPDVVRIVVAGFNRNAIDPGIIAEVRFSSLSPTLNTTTVTMGGAILSDPYGTAVPVTLTPNTVVLEESAGTLQASMATGTASPDIPGTANYTAYPALFVALLFVIVAMAWSRQAPRKGRKR